MCVVLVTEDKECEAREEEGGGGGIGGAPAVAHDRTSNSVSDRRFLCLFGKSVDYHHLLILLEVIGSATSDADCSTLSSLHFSFDFA